MEKLIILFLLFISSATYAHQVSTTYVSASVSQNTTIQNAELSPIPENNLLSKMAPFWITFAIAAIGVYSIYGFGAGIVAVGVTYFVTKGNKKAFFRAIWGCLAGMAVGAVLRFVIFM